MAPSDRAAGKEVKISPELVLLIDLVLGYCLLLPFHYALCSLGKKFGYGESNPELPRERRQC